MVICFFLLNRGRSGVAAKSTGVAIIFGAVNITKSHSLVIINHQQSPRVLVELTIRPSSDKKTLINTSKYIRTVHTASSIHPFLSRNFPCIPRNFPGNTRNFPGCPGLGLGLLVRVLDGAVFPIGSVWLTAPNRTVGFLPSLKPNRTAP